MTYNVYRVEHLGTQTNHVQIFIETAPDDGSGIIYHVTGTILTGMTLEIKPAGRPESSTETFVPNSKTLVGRLEPSNVHLFEAVCRAVPPPGAQLKLNGQPRDPLVPVRRCGEWVEEVLVKVTSGGIML